jgi:hypothetical protein
MLSGTIPYVVEMLRGKTQPSIVTWGLWTFNGIILCAAQISAGASWTVVTLIASTLSTAIVTIIALRRGQYALTSFDAACLAISLSAIGGWAMTSSPLTALVLGIGAEVFAVTPTVIKVYRQPESETFSTYWLTTFATLLALSVSTKFDAANIIFPIYSIGANSLIAILAMRRQRMVNDTSR